MLHLPPVELVHVLLNLQKNPHFIRIGRILLLCLVVLASLGYAGEWVTGLDPSNSTCQRAALGCYTGAPLTLAGYVQLGGSKLLLALPVGSLVAVLLLLFKAQRAYISLFCIGLFSLLLQVFLTADTATPVTSISSGYLLSQVANCVYGFLSLPMAIVEQSRLPPRKRLLDTN